MSDSNIGSRKGKNIRNHLFIIYGIINSVINGGMAPVDIQVYDLEKVFTMMFQHITIYIYTLIELK